MFNSDLVVERHFLGASREIGASRENCLTRAHGLAKLLGILRLRARFAMRSTRCAQDDTYEEDRGGSCLRESSHALAYFHET